MMCSCYGGGSLASYLVKPTATDNYECVGGCGNSGEEFTMTSDSADQSVVKSISFWNGGDRGGFAGIRIIFFDDSDDYTVGTASGDYDAHCEFAPGEALTGDLRISGNTDKSIITYFKAETSNGQTCEAGNEDKGNMHLFNTNNGFFGGLRGSAGEQVNQLAPILWKPIESVVLSQVSYPSFTEQMIQPNPESVFRTYCNKGPAPEDFGTLTQAKEITVGRQKCWSVSAGVEFGVGYSFEASVQAPQVTGGPSTTSTFETHLVLTASYEEETCTDTLRVEEESFVFPEATLGPHSSKRYVYSHYRGTVSNEPFTVRVTVKFTDDTTYEFDAEGTYDGVSFTAIDEYWTDHEEGVTECGGAITGSSGAGP